MNPTTDRKRDTPPTFASGTSSAYRKGRQGGGGAHLLPDVLEAVRRVNGEGDKDGMAF